MRSQTNRFFIKAKGRNTSVILKAGLFCFALSGCASAPPPATFDLNATSVLRARHSSHVFAIAEPSAILPYNSDRVVVRTGTDEVAYLTGAQWVDRLPLVLQKRLITSFENANLARNVGGAGQVANRVVNVDVRRFEINATSASAVVELLVKVNDASSGRIMASRLVRAQLPAPVHGASAMTSALNAASLLALSQVVTFVAGQ